MKLIFKLLFACLLLVGMNAQESRAQGAADVSGVFRAGLTDANKVMNAYFQPFAESFGIGLAQNWYNTAVPLKLLRFNVQLGASYIRIPEEMLTFNPQTLGLTNLRTVDPAVTSAPTINGEGDGPVYAIYGDDPTNPGGPQIKIQEIAGLTSGLGLSANAVPNIQVNLGLIKKTEVSVRYVPTIDLGTLGSDGLSGSVGLWGIGVKHDLLQWIPLASKLPFSVSGYFNYTAMSIELGTSFPGPDNSNYAGNTGPGAVTGFRFDGTPGDYTNQQIALNANAMGFGIIASKKLLIFTPYVSAGFVRSSFSLKTAGDYALPTGLEANAATPDPSDLREIYTNYKDPLDISFDSANTFRAGVGLRLKLLIFAIHAEAFTAGGYNGYNAGLSIGF